MTTCPLKDFSRALSLELNLAQHDIRKDFPGNRVAQMKVEMAVVVEKVDKNKGIYVLRTDISKFNRWPSHQLVISWPTAEMDNVEIYLDGEFLQKYDHRKYV